MRSLKIIVLAALLITLFLAAQGPAVDKLIFIKQEDESKAIRDIIDGRMHIWLWYISTPENLELAKARGLNLINVAGCGVYDLLINPVTPNEGFNPFTIREVREALNWLVDRRYIAEELMKGLGLPQYTLFRVGSPEYVRYMDLMIAYERKYAYDFEKAKQVIIEAMTKAGAVMRDGKWYYGDKPVVVKIIARVEDVRKDIGAYVAEQLKKVGFEVDLQVVPRTVAASKVIRGDPRTGEWHIYTEGWAYTGGMAAYEDDNFEFYYLSPFSGTILNPQYSDYIKKIPPELNETATKLSGGKYKSFAERRALVEKALEYALKESIRVWLVTQKCPMPAAPNVEAPFDLMGGFWSPYSLRAIRFTDRRGGELFVGQFGSFFTEPWNPFNNWLYDRLVLDIVRDSGIAIHPHTGKYTKLRSDFRVETAGPDGTLDVPEDAIKPVVVGTEPGQVTWVKVGPGVKAISHIVWTIPKGYWHYSIVPGVDGNNVRMSIADVLYDIARTFLMVNSSSKTHDRGAITPGMQIFVEKLVALKVEDAGDNIVVRMWVNYWHPDPTYIVQYFDPTPSYPWELWYLMEASVALGRLAWLTTTAKAKNIQPLDLAKGPALEVLKKTFDEIKGSVPDALKGVVSDAEVRARWDALDKWYSRMGHFFVSNGPYYIEHVDTAANQVVLAAFRDYPFDTQTTYAALYKPRVPDIQVLDVISTAPVGLPITATLGATLGGEPYNDVDVKFQLFDAAGNLVYSGSGEGLGGGRFRLEIPADVTRKLKPGVYTLSIVAVAADAAVPVLFTRSIVLTPAAEQIVEEVGQRVGQQLAPAVETLSKAIGDLQGALNLTNSLLVLVIVLLLVNLAISLRRPRGGTTTR